MQDNKQHKKDQYYIWRLISQKLTGNASKNELQELQELLLDNPHIQYSMEILSGLADTGKGANGEANGPPQPAPGQDYRSTGKNAIEVYPFSGSLSVLVMPLQCELHLFTRCHR